MPSDNRSQPRSGDDRGGQRGSGGRSSGGSSRGGPTGGRSGGGGRGGRGGQGDDRRGGPPKRDRGNRGGTGRDREVRPGEEHKQPRKGPAGIERAERRADAPPRGAVIKGKAAPKPKVTEPPLAQDAPIDLPKGIRREIEKVASDAKDANRFLQHLTLALSALDQRDGRTAEPHLRYLKARLPRTGLLREGLGIALYLEERYGDALSELGAYRRLTGNPQHNHLVADALRAVGENTDRIPGLIREMETHNEQHEAEDGHPDDRITDAAMFEGRIVWASWLADSGDVGAGRAVLAPLLGQPTPEDGPDEHHLRLWYVAGDLAQRAGDVDAARTLFERITDHADGFYDTEQRYAALV